MSGVKESGGLFARATSEARAKLFSHGGSQAVRLPKAFRFEGAEVNVRREGRAVILEPSRQGGAELWAKIDAIKVDAPLNYPEQPVLKERDWNW